MADSRYRGRLSGYLRTGFALHSAGVRLSSILGYPIRRRLLLRAEIATSSGHVLSAPASEPLLTVFDEVWRRRCYLPPEILLDADATVIDIGANVGAFSVLASSLVPEGRIIAVEPSARLRSWLERNLAANRICNVTVVGAAVTGRDGRTTLYARGPEVMNTVYMADNYGSLFTGREVVDSVSLDSLFTAMAVTQCGLLKLDCEGAEYDILLNASAKTLQSISGIVGEYHIGLNEYQPADLVAHLAAHGFRTRVMPLMDVESGHFVAWRDS